MCMRKARTGLFDIFESRIDPQWPLAYQRLDIAASHIFEHQIVKNDPGQVACSSVTETADNVGMANPIKSHSLILKILDERSFEIKVDVFLKENIEGFDNDRAVRRPRGSKRITSREDLRITSLSEPFAYVIAPVKPGI